MKENTVTPMNAGYSAVQSREIGYESFDQNERVKFF